MKQSKITKSRMTLKWNSLLWIFLFFLCIFSLPVQAKEENSLSLTGEMQLTVEPSDGAKESLQELTQKDGTLCYDLYMIAELEDKNGIFSFVATQDFASCKEALEKTSTQTPEAERTDYNQLAQSCFQLLFPTEGMELDSSVKATYQGLKLSQKENIRAGLYLLVARSSVQGKTVSKQISDTEMASYTLLGSNYYTCMPQIICMPTKVDANGNILGSNLLEGTWCYDQNIVLKMKIDPSFGSLKLKKNLVGYLKDVEATIFVFQVDVYFPKKDTLYSSEVYTISFDKEGTKELLVDGIPIGSYVQVTEVYSGLNYTASLESPEHLEVVIEKREGAQVEFTNTFNGKHGGTGGITNHFSYTEGDDGNCEWTWEKLLDNLLSKNGKLLHNIQKLLLGREA